MKITVNGQNHEARAADLAALLAECGFEDAVVATAVNEDFVPAPERAGHRLAPGDRVEIVSPRQGG